MALTFCLVCDENYSENLSTCPHCNRDIAAQVMGSLQKQKTQQEEFFAKLKEEAKKAAVEAAKKALNG